MEKQELLNRRVKRICSPFPSLEEYFKWNPSEQILYGKQITNVNFKFLKPIVTEENWIVCYNTFQGGFYRIDATSMKNVFVSCFLKKNSSGNHAKRDIESKIIPKSDFFGLSDDLSLIVGFCYIQN